MFLCSNRLVSVLTSLFEHMIYFGTMERYRLKCARILSPWIYLDGAISTCGILRCTPSSTAEDAVVVLDRHELRGWHVSYFDYETLGCR